MVEPGKTICALALATHAARAISVTKVIRDIDGSSVRSGVLSISGRNDGDKKGKIFTAEGAENAEKKRGEQ
jgi:hypothetical protein